MLTTTRPTPIYLCKRFSCNAYPIKHIFTHLRPIEPKTRTHRGRDGSQRGKARQWDEARPGEAERGEADRGKAGRGGATQIEAPGRQPFISTFRTAKATVGRLLEEHNDQLTSGWPAIYLLNNGRFSSLAADTNKPTPVLSLQNNFRTKCWFAP